MSLIMIQMVCGLSEKELKILYKISYKGRWCDKHISIEDLLSGNPKHLIGEYREAIENLIRNKWLRPYKSQGRTDVCIEKKRRNEVIEILKFHAKEYDFIKNIKFIR